MSSPACAKLCLCAVLITMVLWPTKALGEQPSLTILTDREGYQPGDTVALAGRVTHAGHPVADAVVGIEVRDSLAEPVLATTADSDTSGNYSFVFTLSPTSPVGLYTAFASVSHEGQTALANHAFTVTVPTPPPTQTTTSTPTTQTTSTTVATTSTYPTTTHQVVSLQASVMQLAAVAAVLFLTKHRGRLFRGVRLKIFIKR